ncbi:hypothetical protein BDV93DRAFT_522873, partial [Ceratobasidium sp. AG-I]
MRYPVSRRAVHARLHPRQGVVPVGPAAMPQFGQDASFSLYFTTDGDVRTMTANPSSMPTATVLVIDTAIQTPVFPSALPRSTKSAVSSSSGSIAASGSANATAAAVTASAIATTTALAAAETTSALDPAQRVYDGITNTALHALPPAIFGIAIGGSALIVLLALYCFICRWYYRRLPRSTKRWDVDDQRKKEVFYDDKPYYTPSDDKPPQLVADDRRDVAIGDSYFPQGETWRKFEGRTARHPESFIYTGEFEPGQRSPSSPSISGKTPNSSAPLARPRPRFVQTQRHGQTDSVFSNVSFPTTHRADSIRQSDFYPDGSENYEHDGEVWDLASPSFIPGDARPSMDSTAHSAATNRGSIFADAAARARGSVVVYDSHHLRSPSLDEDPFAGPSERGNAFALSPFDRFASKKGLDSGKRSVDIGRKSVDTGRKSLEGRHTRARSRDVRGALDTLDEDQDESALGHGPSRSPSISL